MAGGEGGCPLNAGEMGLSIAVVGKRYDSFYAGSGKLLTSISLIHPTYRSPLRCSPHARESVIIFTGTRNKRYKLPEGFLNPLPRSSLNRNSDSKSLTNPISPIQSSFLTISYLNFISPRTSFKMASLLRFMLTRPVFKPACAARAVVRSRNFTAGNYFCSLQPSPPVSHSGKSTKAGGERRANWKVRHSD